jgi:hypothetical protein
MFFFDCSKVLPVGLNCPDFTFGGPGRRVHGGAIDWQIRL